MAWDVPVKMREPVGVSISEPPPDRLIRKLLTNATTVFTKVPMGERWTNIRFHTHLVTSAVVANRYMIYEHFGDQYGSAPAWVGIYPPSHVCFSQLIANSKTGDMHGNALTGDTDHPDLLDTIIDMRNIPNNAEPGDTLTWVLGNPQVGDNYIVWLDYQVNQ